jgi:hypothetical protein
MGTDGQPMGCWPPVASTTIMPQATVASVINQKDS